jgi:hypothetical protein
MTLFVISIPLMVLAVAIATVPLIVAMTGEQKERIRGRARRTTPAHMAHFHETAVLETGPIDSGNLVVAGRPGARIVDEPAA